MLQRFAQFFATAAALAALLTGLAQGWDPWTITKRATLGYFAMYLVTAVLLALARIAMTQDVENPSGAAEDAEEPQGIDGTDAAR